MFSIAGDISLLSSHQDQVIRLPEEATLYATNEFCPIAGFVVGDQVLTIQGHPEFDKEYARALLHPVSYTHLTLPTNREV